MEKQHIIPADEYDALELAAMEFGGIGAGNWFKNGDPTCPVCVNGLGIVAGVGGGRYIVNGSEAETPTHIGTWHNDIIVRALIELGRYTVGVDGVSRVTWADFVKHGNIVRGS